MNFSSMSNLIPLEYRVRLKKAHKQQQAFLKSKAKRKVIRAGRRSGKTTGAAIYAIKAFLQGKHVLYAAPTNDQIHQFWKEVKIALAPLIDAGIFIKNESEHTIERAGTEQRLRAKTAWNADTLRGDYADLLILDEFQIMDETTWQDVGAPMLLDKNGEAIFIYTPPSARSQELSRGNDPRHAARLFKKALAQQRKAEEEGKTSNWAAFHFTSMDNPHISEEALAEIVNDMSNTSYKQEILAEDLEDTPGALWKRAIIESSRVKEPPQLDRVGIGVDPPGGATECGIVVAGVGYCMCKGKRERHAFVLQDRSLKGAPDQWARAVVTAYKAYKADRVYAESNYGGDMVESTLRTVEPGISFKQVTASRGKAIRAEPISALYEQGKVHHVGSFESLESEMLTWLPNFSSWSPNRMDALVWVLTELMVGAGGVPAACVGLEPPEELDWLGFPRRRWSSIWDSEEEFENRYRGMFVGDYFRR
jgi:hypothetical protein